MADHLREETSQSLMYLFVILTVTVAYAQRAWLWYAFL